ncbi:ribosomal protein S11 (chloroplast) [Tripterygium wilfordii]|uniref:Ribosomal protein S11 (Chloroplast) n=1 Tax=Tripterygium wilfordii TaxID=458696 RepID=A0A7J7DT08_TRIWF|nr:ribosomal protein S11 (chloroplast) [Tripterygium wilfordii]
MAKTITKTKTSSRRNGRIGSRKNTRRIPKGVIHVQASFNNTIVTVTDVRGRVISWYIYRGGPLLQHNCLEGQTMTSRLLGYIYIGGPLLQHNCLEGQTMTSELLEPKIEEEITWKEQTIK